MQLARAEIWLTDAIGTEANGRGNRLISPRDTTPDE